MAIDSFECKIITGGFNHCDSLWNKSRDELDQCFKIYYPIRGEATVTLDTNQLQIAPGNIYFISGYNIVSQQCTSSMDIYWLHFVPTSLYLRHILLKAGPVYHWSAGELTFSDDLCTHIGKVFRHKDFTTPEISQLPYSYEEARLQAYILNFIADILRQHPNKEALSPGDLSKLKPSIEFMNNEFRENPSLNMIASKSSLAPNYFHRIFKKNFGLTPYNYMLRLRMEMAVRLLTSTTKSVKEV
ncbi:MAG: AraC family transcriptional regulator, partial [Cytophagales bacterium]|nr:AraC family transcriptional regulator [Cytophagales bacterium]